MFFLCAGLGWFFHAFCKKCKFLLIILPPHVAGLHFQLQPRLAAGWFWNQWSGCRNKRWKFGILSQYTFIWTSGILKNHIHLLPHQKLLYSITACSSCFSFYYGEIVMAIEKVTLNWAFLFLLCTISLISFFSSIWPIDFLYSRSHNCFHLFPKSLSK